VGQLGHGDTLDREHPTLIAGSAKSGFQGTFIVQIAVGANHNVALSHDGVAWSWGASNFGQLGLQMAGAPVLEPTMIPLKDPATTTSKKGSTSKNNHDDGSGPGDFAVRSVYCGDSATFLILRKSNQLWVMGEGAVARGLPGADTDTATILHGVPPMLELFCGKRHVLALQAVQPSPNMNNTSGDNYLFSASAETNFQFPVLWGWGDNTLNQLGRTSGYGTCAPFELYKPKSYRGDSTLTWLGRVLAKALQNGSSQGGGLGRTPATTAALTGLNDGTMRFTQVVARGHSSAVVTSHGVALIWGGDAQQTTSLEARVLYLRDSVRLAYVAPNTVMLASIEQRVGGTGASSSYVSVANDDTNWQHNSQVLSSNNNRVPAASRLPPPLVAASTLYDASFNRSLRKLAVAVSLTDDADTIGASVTKQSQSVDLLYQTLGTDQPIFNFDSEHLNNRPSTSKQSKKRGSAAASAAKAAAMMAAANHERDWESRIIVQWFSEPSMVVAAIERFGIPPQHRHTAWPKLIGNPLSLSGSAYQFYLTKAVGEHVAQASLTTFSGSKHGGGGSPGAGRRGSQVSHYGDGGGFDRFEGMLSSEEGRRFQQRMKQQEKALLAISLIENDMSRVFRAESNAVPIDVLIARARQLLITHWSFNRYLSYYQPMVYPVRVTSTLADLEFNLTLCFCV